jgi:hypothetical protein
MATNSKIDRLSPAADENGGLLWSLVAGQVGFITILTLTVYAIAAT